MKANTLAVAIAALLLGSVATAAYYGNRDTPEASGLAATQTDSSMPASPGFGDIPPGSDLPTAEPEFAFADVVSTTPVTRSVPMYAAVIGTSPVRETVSTDNPRQVCEEVVVQERLPERDGDVGGTVAGAILGGLVGNQVGDGNGRKLATVAGAVGGGFAGREIDRRHVGGQVVNRTEQQCRTVSDTRTSTRTVAWDVTYREPDGRTGTLRTDSRPGKQIRLGERQETYAYDVTYRFDGAQRTVRLDRDPGQRLPVIDGEVVAAVQTDGGSGG